MAAPSSAPSGRIIGSASNAVTVTVQPSCVAVAATSQPMNPAPTTSRLVPGVSFSRRCSASSAVRSTGGWIPGTGR